MNQLKLHWHLRRCQTELTAPDGGNNSQDFRKGTPQNVQCLMCSGEASQPWGAPWGSILVLGRPRLQPLCSEEQPHWPPAGLHSNPAKSHLGSKVVTLVLTDTGTCPAVPQQPPCRQDGVGLLRGVGTAHLKPWHGWGQSQVTCWTAWIPTGQVDWTQTIHLWGWLPQGYLHQHPVACKPYFLCFQLPFCLAAAPRRAKTDFGAHCPHSALHWSGKDSVSDQNITYTILFQVMVCSASPY